MIYVLESDEQVRSFILHTLCQQNFPAIGFAQLDAFWAAIKKQTPKLILLSAPTEQATAAIQKLRKQAPTAALPIIILSERSSEYDKVLALDSGADDYITKPFSMLELMARIRALLRRSHFVPHVQEFSMGSLSVNVAKHTAFVDNLPIDLTLKEFELLVTLLENCGTVLSRDQLQNKVWGYESEGASRTVDVHIRTLRQKIGKASEYIQTIRGVGYKISER